ncbi:hypothetical protein K240099F2_07300 [Phocaeicola vulgatus]
MVQTEGGKRLQKTEIVIARKCSVIPSYIHFVKQHDTKILIKLVNVGDRDLFLFIENFHITKVGAIRFDRFLSVSPISLHFGEKSAVFVYYIFEQ